MATLYLRKPHANYIARADHRSCCSGSGSASRSFLVADASVQPTLVRPSKHISSSNRFVYASSHVWKAARPRATLLPDPIPSDLDVTIIDDESLASIEFNEDAKTLRIPLKELGQGARRTKLVMFTCNMCNGRTSRMVNPLAWEKGVVFGQCQHCNVWHTLSANNKKILEEIRYSDYESPASSSSSSSAAAAAASAEGDAAAAEEGVRWQKEQQG